MGKRTAREFIEDINTLGFDSTAFFSRDKKNVVVQVDMPNDSRAINAVAKKYSHVIKKISSENNEMRFKILGEANTKLKEVIRGIVREILNEGKVPKKGDWVELDYNRQNWRIDYVDSSHIELGFFYQKATSVSARGTVYNIDQLRDKPYYKDLVSWMQTGDKKIENKKY